MSPKAAKPGGDGDAGPAAMEEVFRDVLASPVEPDGIDFDDAELQVMERREGAAYPGVRVRVVARLGNARIPFQVDVGFGDAVVDPPAKTELPTVLDLPAPEPGVYPVEAVVAEKIETLVRFDVLNTRLKDYFDLYVLATEVTIDAASLSRQLAETFQRRSTAIPAEEPAGRPVRRVRQRARARCLLARVPQAERWGHKRPSELPRGCRRSVSWSWHPSKPPVAAGRGAGPKVIAVLIE